MTPCLAPDEFVDLADGTLSPARRAHVAQCASCRALAVEMREALALAVSADVPEPSPFFWATLNARVRADIARTAPDAPRWWWRWNVLAPMAGLVALVVALTSTVERAAPAAPAGPGSSVAPRLDVADDPPPLTDDALAMMIDLAADLPEGGWDALDVRNLPDIGEAAAVLATDERHALAALLRSVTDRPPS